MNKRLYLCHPLVLSSPTLMMHGHMNLKFTREKFVHIIGFCESLLHAYYFDFTYFCTILYEKMLKAFYIVFLLVFT